MDSSDTVQDWYSERNATFGDRLAAGREAAGMSQEQLARRLGVKLDTLRKWEEDLAEPRANRLSMLSGLLGVSIRWLLTGEGTGVTPPEAEPDTAGDVSALMTEMRALRGEAMRLAERIGRVEKRLRGIGGGAA